MATKELFANLAKSLLASGIAAGDTSLSVTATEGTKFRAPVAGQLGRLVLKDTSGNFEICTFTGRTSDTITGLTRGQEGTTARAWLAGDIVQMRLTRSSMEGLGQLAADEQVTGNWEHVGDLKATGKLTAERGINVFAMAGTDTYTGTLAPAITAYVLGAVYVGSVTNANTSTTPTLNLNAIAAKTIVRDDTGGALAAGDIGAGRVHAFRYDGTNLRLLNPVNVLATDTALPGNPTAATQNPNNESTRLANTAFVKEAVGNTGEFVGCAFLGAVNLPQGATRVLSVLGGASYAVDGTASKNYLSNAFGWVARRLIVSLSAAVPAGQSITVVLRKNNVDTALTVTLSAGETLKSVSADVAIAPYLVREDLSGGIYSNEIGDGWYIAAVTSAAFGTTNDVKVCLVGTFGRTDKGAPIGTGSWNNFLHGGYNTTLGDFHSVYPVAATHVPLPIRSRAVFNGMRQLETSSFYSLAAYSNLIANPDIGTNALATAVLDYEKPFIAANAALDIATIHLYHGAGGTAERGAGCADLSDRHNRGIGSICPNGFSSYAQAQGTTLYMVGRFAGGASATESDVSVPVPECDITGLRVLTNALPPGAGTVTVTLVVNGVDTALQAVINASSPLVVTGWYGAVDTTHRIAVNDQSLISLKCVTSAASGTISVQASIEVQRKQ